MNEKKVLIASLLKSYQPWHKRFFEQLDSLEYPEKLVRYAFVEDIHIPLLHQWCKKRNSWINKENPPITDRFERLAYLRNLIIEQAHPLSNEDYVLWIDSDIVKVPSTLIQDLMKYDAPVIAPTVWIEETDQFYDTLAFRDLRRERNFPAWNIPWKGLVEVSSVGTCLMVASRLYTESKLRYHGGDSEQATFCKNVRVLGERIYVDFDIRIEHANLPRYGGTFH